MTADIREQLHRRADMIRSLAHTLSDARARRVLEAAADEIERLDAVSASLMFDPSEAH